MEERAKVEGHISCILPDDCEAIGCIYNSLFVVLHMKGSTDATINVVHLTCRLGRPQHLPGVRE